MNNVMQLLNRISTKAVRPLIVVLVAANLAVPQETNAATVGLPITSQYYETHNFVNAYMRRYQIYWNGFLKVEMKLRGKEKARGAVYINGEPKWFHINPGTGSDNFTLFFAVRAGDTALVGEKGGSLGEVQNNYINIYPNAAFNMDIIPNNLLFRKYDKSKITRTGRVDVKIKARGSALAAMAVKINGPVVWKYWRLSSTSRNIVRSFTVPAYADVHVGEVGGSIEYVNYTPY